MRSLVEKNKGGRKKTKKLREHASIFPANCKNASVVHSWGKWKKKAIWSLKKGMDNAKTKWATHKDIMNEIEKIKAPNVSP